MSINLSYKVDVCHISSALPPLSSLLDCIYLKKYKQTINPGIRIDVHRFVYTKWEPLEKKKNKRKEMKSLYLNLNAVLLLVI